MRRALASLLVLVMLATPAAALDFPYKLEAGKYTLEVPKENAPWTVFDSKSMTATLTSIASLKLEIESLERAGAEEVDYLKRSHDLALTTERAIAKVQLDAAMREIALLESKVKKLDTDGRFLGLSYFEWGLVLGLVMGVGAAK